MRIHPFTLVLLLAAVGLAATFGVGLLEPTQADDDLPSAVYVSVSGDGPTAKGWFAGAPPAGMLIQDALDHFSEKGYRVKSISPSLRQNVTLLSGGQEIRQLEDLENFYVILMER